VLFFVVLGKITILEISASEIIVEKTHILVESVFTMNRIFEYNRYGYAYHQIGNKNMSSMI
jgi:hypothetical protein